MRSHRCPERAETGLVDTLTKYLAVAAGSALGGVLRYFLGSTILARTAAPFPAATFVINVTALSSSAFS